MFSNMMPLLGAFVSSASLMLAFFST